MVCRIVIEVSELIRGILREEHVEKLSPNTAEELKTTMVDIESEWQFTFAFSAFDGSHLPIKYPKGGSGAMKQYYSFKNIYSKILLVLVDARYHFTRFFYEQRFIPAQPQYCSTFS